MRYTGTKMYKKRAGEAGFTLIELTVTVVIIGIVVVSFFGLFISLVNSTIIARRQAVALTLATNQMERLKSLPYDSLIVQSPTTSTQTLNGVTYTIRTNIVYVDDAYDGCGSYATVQLAKEYCRNYPATGTPPLDQNPADYKDANVVVTDSTGRQLATVDTQIAARVSETASATGALFVTVTDLSGAPLPGATVNISNNALTPVVSKSDTTDSNGMVIFYGLPPDSNTDYVINATKAGYSSLTTINASGSLQPTYANQKILSQQSSYTTLKLAQQGTNSLLVETTNTSGGPLANVKVYIKGGYKKYTSSTDTSYYFDNLTPTDSRPLTDSSGFAGVQNLVPINGYIFCGDNGSSGCSVGSTAYYLAAAIPYGGSHSLGPITIPQYDPNNPPATTYSYGGVAYLQEVRLMLTTNSSFPRVFAISPDNVSLSGGGLSSFPIAITGYNLSGASAKLVQNGTTYSGSGCTSSAQQLSCNYNLTTMVAGTPAQLTVTNGAGSLTLPVSPQLGGFNVNS